MQPKLDKRMFLASVSAIFISEYFFTYVNCFAGKGFFYCSSSATLELMLSISFFDNTSKFKILSVSFSFSGIWARVGWPHSIMWARFISRNVTLSRVGVEHSSPIFRSNRGFHGTKSRFDSDPKDPDGKSGPKNEDNQDKKPKRVRCFFALI